MLGEFCINFNKDRLITKIEQLANGEIKYNELDLDERDIRQILLCLRTAHCWEELLDYNLGFRQ